MDLFDKGFFVWNLTFIYRMIVASEPLLEYALGECQEGDLRRYYLHHLEEERGHDLMLLKDLEQFKLKELPRHWDAARLAGAQYYLIKHEHPAALLGYMHTLESNCISLELVEALEDHHGCSLTALRHHAEVDTRHAAELTATIEKQTQELQQLCRWNADNTFRSLRAVMLNYTESCNV